MTRSKITGRERIIQSEKGMALVLVLVFTAALMVLGAALVTYAVSETLIAAYNNRDIRLYYLVEGGAEIGIAALKQDFYYDRELVGSMGGGTYTVSFSNEYQHFDPDEKDEEGENYYENNFQVRFVRCIATLEGYSKTMTIAMKLDENEQVTIKYWYKAFPKHF